MTSAQFRALWLEFHERVAAERDQLNRLDAAIGDADHGTNLDRGLQKVAAYAAGTTDHLAAACRQVGTVLLSTVGGASGALWGSALLRAAPALPDSDTCDTAAAVLALRQGVGAIQARGHAELGDKTMLDVWLPCLDELDKRLRAGAPCAEAVAATADRAGVLAQGTAPLEARRGRAAYLGPRSVGHVDPGSMSTALFWQALATVLARP